MDADWADVYSTCLSAARWGEDEKGRGYLDVRIRESGRVYRYRGVSWKTYRRLLDSPSRGTFYNREIKPNYPDVEELSG